jgi:hypothetical protein
MVNRVASTHRGASTQQRRPGFTYKFRTEQAVKDRAEKKGGGRFDSPFKPTADLWRPKAGENQIRILPPTWDDHEHFGYEIWVHSWVGSENGTYLCPSKHQGRSCPVCRLAKQAKDNGDEEDWQQLKVKQHYVYWVIDRESENQHPQLWELGWQLDRDIVALTYNKRSTSNKVLYIDHPEEGYDIVLRRSGEKLNTRYLPSIIPEHCPIFDDARRCEEIMNYIQEHPIPDMLHFYDNAYLERVMTGAQEQTDADLDEQQQPLEAEETSQDYDHEGAEAAQANERAGNGAADEPAEGEEGYYDANAAQEGGEPWEEEQPAEEPAPPPQRAPARPAATQRPAQTRPAAQPAQGRTPAQPPRRQAAPPPEEPAEEEFAEEVVEEAAPPARPAPRPPSQRPAAPAQRPAAQAAPRPAQAARPAQQARPQAPQRPAAAPSAGRPTTRPTTRQ